jgi:hypothetical protein
MIIKNSLYINSLEEYIKDTKPYHVKLTDVIEELYFSDTINAHVDDSNYNIGIHLSSLWGKSYYSDGYRTRYVLPTFLTPRYSVESNNFFLNSISDQLDYLNNPSTFNLPNAFQISASQGVETVVIDGLNKIEGVDYFLSKGIYSFAITTTNGIKTWNKTNSTTKTVSKIVYDNFSTNPYLSIKDIVVPAGFESYWELKVLETISTYEVIINSDTNTVVHNLHGDVYYQIFENNKLILPQNVFIINQNKTQINFTIPAIRKIKVATVFSDNVFNFTTVSNVCTIHHNLNSLNILNQVYVNISGVLVCIIPESVKLISNSAIEIKFSQNYSGKVVLFYAQEQLAFTNQQTITIPGFALDSELDYSVYINDISGSFLEILGATSITVDTLTNTQTLNINFSAPFSGIINFNHFKSPKCKYSVVNKFTNTLVGIGFDNTLFSSSSISFNTDFHENLEVGDVSEIRPTNQIAVSPNAINETWSVIKVNPLGFNIVSPITTHNKLDLVPFTPSLIDAPAEIWTFTFDLTSRSFIVSGSVSGSDFANANLGAWYDNGLVRVKFVLSPNDYSNLADKKSATFNENFKDQTIYINDYTNFVISKGAILDGEQFTLQIFEDKPSYVVYGSISQHFEYATVGKYFWNGKIGFMPSLPYYSIMQTPIITPSQYFTLTPTSTFGTGGYGEYYDANILSTVAGKNIVTNDKFWFLRDTYPIQWNIKEGCISYDETYFDDYPVTPLAINFVKPPRFDAVDEQITLTYNEFIIADNSFDIPTQQFRVSSDLTGLLPAALLGIDYTNFESSTMSLTYDNVGAINFNITSNNDPIPNNTSLVINIVSNFIKPFHSKNVIIVKNPFANIEIKTFNTDKLELQISTTHNELGTGYNNEQSIPTFVIPQIRGTGVLSGYDQSGYGDNYDGFSFSGSNLFPGKQPVIPSRFGDYDLIMHNSLSTPIGKISYQYDSITSQNYHLIDFNRNFLNKYLPINSNFTFNTYQSDQYNHLTSVIMTEEVKFQDLVRFKDFINVDISDLGYDGSMYDNIFGYDSNYNGRPGFDPFPENLQIKITDKPVESVGTLISETIAFADVFRFSDSINISIAELTHHVDNVHLIGMMSGYDSSAYGVFPYDWVNPITPLGTSEFPLDTIVSESGFSVLSRAVGGTVGNIFFVKMPALTEHKIINSVNTLCSFTLQYSTLPIEYGTIEIPMLANNILLCTDINNIDTTKLIEGTDYILTNLNIAGTKTFTVDILIAQPIIIIAF